MNAQGKSPTRFAFTFHATVFRKDPAFVARVTWDFTQQKIHREHAPLERKPKGRFHAEVTGTFIASVGDIIEAQRGRTKERDSRAFFLVAPSGTLILVAFADELDDVIRVGNYLAGRLAVEDLGKGGWVFDKVRSDWNGEPVSGEPQQRERTPSPSSSLSRDNMDRRTPDLLHELSRQDAIPEAKGRHRRSLSRG
ncbi:MAG: hypothetical protein GDA67_11415 [Nitrospira sp. CR1.3]|nr:hypothetical protein [Nitrospira sp. CR1.3]